MSVSGQADSMGKENVSPQDPFVQKTVAERKKERWDAFILTPGYALYLEKKNKKYVPRRKKCPKPPSKKKFKKESVASDSDDSSQMMKPKNAQARHGFKYNKHNNICSDVNKESEN